MMACDEAVMPGFAGAFTSNEEGGDVDWDELIERRPPKCALWVVHCERAVGSSKSQQNACTASEQNEPPTVEPSREPSAAGLPSSLEASIGAAVPSVGRPL